MLSGATGTCDWGWTHIDVERKHTEWRDHHTNQNFFFSLWTTQLVEECKWYPLAVPQAQHARPKASHKCGVPEPLGKPTHTQPNSPNKSQTRVSTPNSLRLPYNVTVHNGLSHRTHVTHPFCSCVVVRQGREAGMARLFIGDPPSYTDPGQNKFS